MDKTLIQLTDIGVKLIQVFPEEQEPYVVVQYRGVDMVKFYSQAEAARFVSDEFLLV